MTYEQAQEKSLTVPWKVVTCHQGESCWCRMIEPLEPIYWQMENGDPEEYDLVGSGSIGKELAEYLVNLHNQTLNGK